MDLDSLDSIRCFFAVLFLARDQKVELEQIDDDIQVTLIDDITPRFAIYPVGKINERSCDLCFVNFSSSILKDLSLPETSRELD